MDYTVRPAKMEDLYRIQEIYAAARAFMRDHGNPKQWGNTHPPLEKVREDVEKGRIFVLTPGDAILGGWGGWVGIDRTYERIDGSWRSDSAYGTIHRIAGDGSGRILKTAVTFAGSRIRHLRIDTHEDNLVMQNAVARLGFQRRGIIYLGDGSPRLAYDLLLDTL